MPHFEWRSPAAVVASDSVRMGYKPAVDLGDVLLRAATVDGSAPGMAGLGNRAIQVPSVLLLDPKGSSLAGEAAEPCSIVDPE